MKKSRSGERGMKIIQSGGGKETGEAVASYRVNMRSDRHHHPFDISQ